MILQAAEQIFGGAGGRNINKTSAELPLLPLLLPFRFLNKLTPGKITMDPNRRGFLVIFFRHRALDKPILCGAEDKRFGVTKSLGKLKYLRTEATLSKRELKHQRGLIL